ncbi:hypothetical protein BQ8482_90009 [Mesorhizobium delmotii]|uniref:Uncharacterized protein n=1 Tax=Mesorhizobium delmotii TaxID=1631247 RepID=A0A2P9AWP8_9HYPH|nr:hypothetical protein BQ8482_90009 [Mesorhizobium delmotii]
MSRGWRNLLFGRQRLVVGEMMMQHLGKVPLVERLATNGAELEVAFLVVGRRPVALALDAGCGVVDSISSHVWSLPCV